MTTKLAQITLLACLSLATIFITHNLIVNHRNTLHASDQPITEDQPLNPDNVASLTNLTLNDLTPFQTHNVPQGNFVLNATLDVQDNAQDHTLYWHLYVFQEPPNPDGSYNVIQDQVYQQQPLTVPLGLQSHTTFQESLNLIPGNYTLKLALDEYKTLLQDNGALVTLPVEYTSVFTTLNVQE